MLRSSSLSIAPQDTWLRAREGTGVLNQPLMFTWPLAGPFGAMVLAAMMWISLA